MSEPTKVTAREELERIEEAFVRSILNATDEEVRNEIVALGGNPDALVARVSEAIASARSKATKRRLEAARANLAGWQAKSTPLSVLERDVARTRLQHLRSGNSDSDTRMLMAARKGVGLSESDIEGLIEDLAELKRLESSEGND